MQIKAASQKPKGAFSKHNPSFTHPHLEVGDLSWWSWYCLEIATVLVYVSLFILISETFTVYILISILFLTETKKFELSNRKPLFSLTISFLSLQLKTAVELMRNMTLFVIVPWIWSPLNFVPCHSSSLANLRLNSFIFGYVL